MLAKHKGRCVSQTFVALLCLSWLSHGGVLGQTLHPQKVFGRYQQQVWRDEDGLPQNTLHAITRTRDGYLWLATAEGVARFDGVRFTVFDNSNTGAIRHNHIMALLEDRAENLWIGTAGGGVSRLADGRFTTFTTRDGLSHDFVTCLLEDRAGDLWIGTAGGGLNRFRDGRLTAYATGDRLPHGYVTSLAEDREGALWIGTLGGLVRLTDGRFTTYTTKEGLAHDMVRVVYLDRAENLWVGMEGGGLARLQDGHFIAYGAAEGLNHDNVWALLEDREGTLWVGTFGGGLYRFQNGRFSAYTERDGLPSDIVRTIYQDPEGDLWLGTNGGGLTRFRDGGFKVYTVEDGLSHDSIRAIYEDAAGALWLGSDKGLNRFQDGKFTNYTTADGLPRDYLHVIGEDRSGSLWFGTLAGIAQLKEGRFLSWTTKEGLSNNWTHAILGDRAGDLWVGTNGGGLNRFRDGGFTAYTTREGLVDDCVFSLSEDRAGHLWIGTRSGISRWKDGRFTNWTTADGLADSNVLSFYEDGAGSIWIGTHGGGLHRFKDGKFAAITAKDGLYDNVAFQILADDSGNLWMSCNKGIYRASLEELNDFADGRVASVTSYNYGTADGMLNRECNGAQPAGWKTRDGRLWFPTIQGAVVIDPQQRNLQPPRVAVEEVRLDHAAWPKGEAVRINPSQKELEIHYTALSWNRPPQLKFKYQMMGLDDGWTDAGTRRTAYYSHLPPGSYTFRVKADNGDGVWSVTDATVAIVILPPFWRTWWFVSLGALALVGAIVAAFRFRGQQLKRKQLAQEDFSRHLMEAHETERRRIAAELHDSLGQSLAMIKNSAAFGVQAAGDPGAAQAQFARITEQSAHAISEVREISYDLRPYMLDQFGLAKAIKALLDKIADSSALQITTAREDVSGLLPAEVEMSLYRIVQESLNNILKHADAIEVEVSMKKNEGSVELEIRDNGKGFDPRATRNGGRGGFGLLGIYERVRLLGGTHAIRSAPGEGTTVTIVLSNLGVRREA